MPDKGEAEEKLRMEKVKEQKKRKKQLKQQQERQKKRQAERAVIDKQVTNIYTSGLADAYKFFLQEAYKEQVRFNIFQYAAQKVLKFEKNKKQKMHKLQQLHLQK